MTTNQLAQFRALVRRYQNDMDFRQLVDSFVRQTESHPKEDLKEAVTLTKIILEGEVV